MAEVALNRARINAVCQLVAARMSKHMRMDFHLGGLPSALHHLLEATRGERRAALADKHESA
jgi:hypothetical protein